MDIMELGAIGELVGGVAVVVTLAYLALQIRQGSATIKSAAHQDAVRASFDLSLKLVEPEVNTLITAATLDWGTLPATEQNRFHNYASALFGYFEALFYAHQAGNVDREIWQSRVLRMRAMFGFDAFVSAWDERKIGFGESFQDFIDREIAVNPIDIFASSRKRILAERQGGGEENEP